MEKITENKNEYGKEKQIKKFLNKMVYKEHKHQNKEK